MISIINKNTKNKLKVNKDIKNKITKFCCKERKNKSECTKINLNINFFKLHKNKYAIITLLFGGDSYLPGVLLLGSSIKKVMPKEIKKHITLCCMVTNDVSSEAQKVILKIYDRVINVDYLQISPNLIKHSNKDIQNIYSKTFTKLRIFEMLEYDKILFLDADMLILNKNIFSLFNLNTPAAIFMGKLSNNQSDRYFKNFKENGILFKQFEKKYCYWNGKNLHGNLIPYNKYENENTNDGINIETSIFLIKPSINIIKQRDNFLNYITENKIKIKSDTGIISKMFKNNIYAIEPRFFSRWIDPKEHPELIVLDLYGRHGKPWDINKFQNFKGFKDIEYWWELFVLFYENNYKKFNNDMLNKLYEKIKNNIQK